jgi:prevent-host-death family protein
MVNIYEVKAKLSEYIDAATKGERVMICRHNQPVAELRPVEPARAEPRDLGPMYPGATFTPPAFFEPLGDDEIAAWEGTAADVSTVAEARAGYSAKSGLRRKGKARR